jgi:uncharacterized protein (TIGR00156 family)
MSTLRAIGLLTLLAVAGSVGAAYTGPQAHSKVSVAQLNDLADGSLVMLEGTLVEYLGDDHYRFRDVSGEVAVDVESEVWHGIDVGPSDLIRIRGELERRWNSLDVEVDSLEKIKVSPAAPSAGGFITP